jgi:hypothetical protein
VSYAAIAMLVTGRGWVIATVAALLGGVGAFSGAMLNVLVGVNLAAAALAHMTQQAAALSLVNSFHSVPAQVATDVYFLSEFAAPVVMGVALWRSQSVPRWLAVLFVVGLGIAEGLPSWGPIALLLMLPVHGRDGPAGRPDLAGRQPRQPHPGASPHATGAEAAGVGHCPGLASGRHLQVSLPCAQEPQPDPGAQGRGKQAAAAEQEGSPHDGFPRKA